MRSEGLRWRGGRLAQAGSASLLRLALARWKGWAAGVCLVIVGSAFFFAAYWQRFAFASGFSGSDARQADSGFWSGIFPGGYSRSPKDPLDALFASGLNPSSCLSRHNATIHRKPSLYKPSKYLIRKLRQYEVLHRRCGPNTESYKKSVQYLVSGRTGMEEAEIGCKYLVWIPYLGLGNRILSLASTFLYALLTDRVVLINPMEDFASLMCEPFPSTSWILPSEFPIANMNSFWKDHPSSYGKLVKDEMIKNKGVHDAFSIRAFHSFVYLHLTGGFTAEDSYFFCEADQLILREVPWLLVRSDEYFVPALFWNSVFMPELDLMFPEKEAVFHHLCHYLFHPSNEIWGMITRYYETYLLGAWKTVGIQIRVFDEKEAPFDVVLTQVINCTLTNKLLPEVDLHNPTMGGDQRKNVVVLITSLYSGYSQRLKNMYWEHPAVEGMLVSVHQPSHEEIQQTGKRSHDMKAWAEMYLLSYADVLVTSAQSTFGYVSQALGGKKPWILLRPEKAVVPEPTCIRDTSMEPCFHSLPHNVCKDRKKDQSNKVVPYITSCMDVPWGIKLVNHTM